MNVEDREPGHWSLAQTSSGKQNWQVHQYIWPERRFTDLSPDIRAEFQV